MYLLDNVKRIIAGEEKIITNTHSILAKYVITFWSQQVD